MYSSISLYIPFHQNLVLILLYVASFPKCPPVGWLCVINITESISSSFSTLNNLSSDPILYKIPSFVLKFLDSFSNCLILLLSHSSRTFPSRKLINSWYLILSILDYKFLSSPLSVGIISFSFGCYVIVLTIIHHICPS